MSEPEIRSAGDDAETRHLADEAARLLGDGRLVIIPTETVYGLAADAMNGEAVARIYAAKDRPRFNPLIAHVADHAMAENHGIFGETAHRLADAFWPGPLTLVVPRKDSSNISDLTTVGLRTVALRMPDSAVTRSIVAALGHPVAAPSANRSGRVSPTTMEAAVSEVGDHVALAIDTGPCRVGLESTIVAVADDGATLLRPGGIPRGEIEKVINAPLAAAGAAGGAPAAPGMLASHYAPAALVRLNADELAPGEALLAFGPVPPAGWQGARAVLNLSESGDLTEAAANLFAHLRALDQTGASTIAVMTIPDVGLGEAINDRLRRAAGPRG